ncbi:MAG: RNA-directed DNA polymerase [Planctomycetaceae bacterium]|nr:RNA-directed DNA polymerase [Planctomycetaceae bacterium]
MKVSHLADAMLAGVWVQQEITERVLQVVKTPRRWVPSLVRRTILAFPDHRPLRSVLCQFLMTDDSLRSRACDDEFEVLAYSGNDEFDNHRFDDSARRPVRWQTFGQLAEFLDLEISELSWLADLRGLQRTAPDGPLNHYHRRWQLRRRAVPRLIESPKPRLKSVQRRILQCCLSRLPLHSAAHGFRKGRSVSTFLQHHAGQSCVVRLDLHDFFGFLSPIRLLRLLMMFGYSESVARTITAICSTTTPEHTIERMPQNFVDRRQATTLQRLRSRHFPQGAPTSPAIANLIAWKLDQRLTGLATTFGATYSRYADDLLFSGDEDFRRRAQWFTTCVAAVAMDEGFEVQHRKTRIMTRSVRQQACGLVLNHRPTVSRREYDVLKATLHNAVRFGPESQNRSRHSGFRQHLLGRINYVRQWNPARAVRLMALFDSIRW